VQGSDVGEVWAAEQDSILVLECRRRGAVEGVWDDPGGAHGGLEVDLGDVGLRHAALLRRHAALGAVDSGQALVDVLGGSGEGRPGLGSAVDVVLEWVVDFISCAYSSLSSRCSLSNEINLFAISCTLLKLSFPDKERSNIVLCTAAPMDTSLSLISSALSMFDLVVFRARVY
jgi:hypothetical protein